MAEPIEDEFKSMTDLVPALLWRASADTSYDWFNQPWLTYTGQDPKTALGSRGWKDLMHPADIERFQRERDAAFETRRAFSVEYRLRRHDGVFRWMLDSGQPRVREGEFLGFVGCCIDITDHRSTQRTLRAALAERDVLLREVHHRVKNNMQTLMALVRFMRRTADPDGRALLDVLNARLVAMAIVQRYLHASDNMTEVSVKTLLSSIASQLAETELGVVLLLADSKSDLVLAAPAAAYTGLAAAEAAVLLCQCGATAVTVALRNERAPKVEVRGAASGPEIARSQLGLRLVRQYARGAGAGMSVVDMDGDLLLVFQFPEDVLRSNSG